MYCEKLFITVLHVTYTLDYYILLFNTACKYEILTTCKLVDLHENRSFRCKPL